DRRQLIDGRSEPVAAAGRVLKHDHRSAGDVGRLRERLVQCDRYLLDGALRPGPEVRSDVDVDVPCAVRGPGPEVVREQANRLIVEAGIGPGEVDEIRGMDRD